ncbi:hypothetical protein CVIRNUC_001991 [Coccomyxa viridis]|uniref:Extracellular protein n=1 Tax=Coccomyxa viridis TaxID=1274662 RepID=A0AAV1HY55_9CHLO|nr:hypothetical protein CVIRNUC_001991 [Coccomyxa viridis]
MQRTVILAVCAFALLIASQQVSAGGTRQLDAEAQATLIESRMTGRHLMADLLTPGTASDDNGSAESSSASNGGSAGGTGAGSSGPSSSQAPSAAAKAPASLAPASG